MNYSSELNGLIVLTAALILNLVGLCESWKTSSWVSRVYTIGTSVVLVLVILAIRWDFQDLLNNINTGLCKIP